VVLTGLISLIESIRGNVRFRSGHETNSNERHIPQGETMIVALPIAATTLAYFFFASLAASLGHGMQVGR
jgi:hypothetical protein